ncbi:GGDEF domain-containing protein [Arvimicrobium flavum]|uniref:GGDEF domain-containing protein n=1 Tax=Arvimicrobium flavum TaxID=3393320 RepID=UPI00237B7BA4|nr:GGDEF domain-containing protein [Mesorhizobium shangrilense]
MLRYLERPEVWRSIALFGLVLLGVEAIVTFYYWDAGYERLRFELVISAIITAVVGIPALAFIIHQHIAMSTLNARLAHLSATDQMTDLLNRQTFLDRLGVCLHEHGRRRSAGVFAYVDADHFKTLNDRFGHEVGDQVIVLLADCIRAAARPGDLCARLGGEEFGLFLKGATHDEAAAIAEALRRDVELAGLKLNAPGFALSVSIGLAAHRCGVGALELMREADRSLYAAKNGGRNTVVIDLRRSRVA